MKKENNTNEFKKLIILFVVFLGVIFLSIFLLRALKFHNDKKSIAQDYQYMQNIQQYRDENASLYADQTGDPEEVANEDESPCQVFLLNSNFWTETNFSQYQILSFTPCAEQYLTLNTDISRWHITLSEFHPNYMAPFFFMTIDEYPDRKYKCIWNDNKKGYAFVEIN